MKRWARLIIYPVVILIVLILGIMALPGLLNTGHDSSEAKTKAKLHSIQIAVERYKVDREEYPPYLLGGDKEGWEYYLANLPEGVEPLVDPLIAGDYFDSYPENAYAPEQGRSMESNRRKVKSFQKLIKGPEGRNFDPRFGMNGNIMGNVLEKPIYAFISDNPNSPDGYPRMCPGQFYYQAFGEVSTGWEPDEMEIYTPDNIEYNSHTYYIMGAFGEFHNPGKDAIRWTDLSGELPANFPYVSNTEFYENSTGVDLDIHLQLPATLGWDKIESQPIWPPLKYEKVTTNRGTPGKVELVGSIIGAAPDGFNDGVILVLTGSPDYR